MGGADTEYLFVPRWAPDGHGFVVELDRFASSRLDEEQVVSTTIALVDLTTGEAPTLRELLPIDQAASYPDWGADDRIVFMRPVDTAAPEGPSDLYTMDISGRDVRRVTSTGADGRQALQASWTPEWSRIIFVEQDGMNENVRMSTILPDGSGLTSATGAIDLSGTHPRLRPLP